MNNLKLSKCCFIAAAIALLAVFVAAPAGAGDLNRLLHGDYTWNVAATCANAACGINPATGKYDCQDPLTWGFDPVTLALRVPGSQKSTSYTLQGVVHFDGHGNITFKGEGLGNRLSPGTIPPDVPANQLDLNCDGTYIVDSEGNELFVDITYNNCTATIKSGAFMGWEINISGPTTVRGRLDTVTGSSNVIISNTVPYIEESKFIIPPLGLNEQRICNNMGSMVKLSPRRNWFSKE